MAKSKQTIVFRADASKKLATGHIMRCLTLAHGLKNQFKQYRIVFICNKLPDKLQMQISQADCELLILPFDVDSANWQQSDDADATMTALIQLGINSIDLLVVDHYLIDHQWQNVLRKKYKKLLVIDDLANRNHLADFLLDQTLNRQPNDYLQRLPFNCQLLLGQKHMLLRDEFMQLIPSAKQKRSRTTAIEHLLVNLGGFDNDNVTQLVIEALIEYQTKQDEIPSLTVDIVMTSHSPYIKQISNLIQPYPWLKLILDCHDMSAKMLQADLAIGACGTTAWERCSLGLPTLAIVLAENQKLVNENLSKQQAIINLGDYKQLTSKKIISAIKQLKHSLTNYHTLVSNSFSSCDGIGTQRVVARLMASPVTLKKAAKKDLQLTFTWQSTPEIRQFSRNPNTVSLAEHSQWFINSLALKTRHMFMICSEEQKLGVLRLDECTPLNIDKAAPTRYEISILIAPQAQGQKLAVKAMHALPKTFENSEVFAYVNVENHASQQLFRQANFIKLTNDSFLRPTYTGSTTDENK